MAQVNPTNGRYELGGSRDVDLDGINANDYDVFTDEDKLKSAQAAYPDYDWFVSYTIKDKAGNDVRDLPEYSFKFERPEKGNLYYFLDGSAHPIDYGDAEDKGDQRRAEAKLTVGDPPVGIGGG
jgi:hypothetical protein